MPLTRTSSFLLTFSLVLLSSCSRYSVSINKNVVYEPAQLFSAYEINDNALKECVRSTIAENNLTKAEQLSHLICPAGNIENLEGIETFSHIEYLGLGNNKIINIANIASLGKLQHLDISNNNVVNFSHLSSLEKLSLLKAKGNTQADCDSFKNLAGHINLDLPKHCLSNLQSNRAFFNQHQKSFGEARLI